MRALPKVLVALAAAVLALTLGPTAGMLSPEELLNLVDPFIGTGGIGFGVGSLPPGAQVPFGLARPSPDTSEALAYEPWNHDGGYYYPDADTGFIRAFSHTHMVGAGVADLGNIGVMPTSAALSNKLVTNYGFRSRFSHDHESASPGYYSVLLLDPGVLVELTATLQGAVHRYSFPASGERNVLFYISHTVADKACVASSVEVDVTNQLVTGWILNAGGLSGRSPAGGLKQYFVARFNESFVGSGTWSSGTLSANTANATGTDVGAYVSFGSAVRGVELYVGISIISIEQAAVNLLSQIPPGTSFDEVLAWAQADWVALLGRLQVSDASAARSDLVMLYTAFYHSHLAPTTYSESGSVYLGFDFAVHELAPLETRARSYYSDMSIWDVFRTQMPLLMLSQGSRVADIVHSLVLMLEQGGDIPRWPLANFYTDCMTGDHANLIIAEAYAKGIRDFNVTQAYAGMYAQATSAQPHAGRADIADYIRLGWVCSDVVSNAASLTLEYCADDWALSLLAGMLGNDADAELFGGRAFNNFKNIWNEERGIFCGKTCAGAWDCSCARCFCGAFGILTRWLVYV